MPANVSSGAQATPSSPRLLVGAVLFSSGVNRASARVVSRREKKSGARRAAAAGSSQTNKLECTAPRVTVFFAVPRVERWMRVLILQCRASSRSLAIV